MPRSPGRRPGLGGGGGGEGDFFAGRSIGPTCERKPAVTTASRTHQWKGGWRMAAAAASQSGQGGRGDQSGGSSRPGGSGSSRSCAS
nr:unnamed protein product [Digitaria exilis]